MSFNYDDIIGQLPNISQWSPKNEALLLGPFQHITSVPGKEIRSALIEAFNEWCQIPPEKVAIISRLVGMLHSASLLIDDVEDHSQMRRGIPVAHKIFGVPQTINSANYVYFLAFQEIFRLRSSPNDASEFHELEKIVTEELINLHRGQGLELFWRDSLTCPTEEEYLAMVNNKTGGLFRLAIKLMMNMSKAPADYIPLGNLLGIVFQIRDDYMNLQSSQYEANKGFAEDLTEGKFSFPIVHAVRADELDQRVINVLQKRPESPSTKNYIISHMRDHTKSFEYTRGVLKSLDKQARDEISRLGGNDKLLQLLDKLKIPE
jgi:geranylgeranyl diphosphate synthase type 3